VYCCKNVQEIASEQSDKRLFEVTENGAVHYSVTSFCGHVLRKEDTDWVKKCMEYEVESSRPRGRAKRTWREVMQKDCEALNLNREDAINCSRWKKLIKI